VRKEVLSGDELKIVEAFSEIFPNGSFLDSADIDRLRENLKEILSYTVSSDFLKSLLSKVCFKIYDRYFSIYSAVSDEFYQVIESILEEHFQNGYSRIYICQLFNKIRNESDLSEGVNPNLNANAFGEVIEFLSDGKYIMNGKSGFLRQSRSTESILGVDDEIINAVLELLKEGQWLTVEEIHSKLYFYPPARINEIFDKSAKVRAKSKEWQEIIEKTNSIRPEYIHVETVYLTESDKTKTSNTIDAMRGCDFFKEEKDELLAVAGKLLEKAKEAISSQDAIKADKASNTASTIIDLAQTLMPKDEILASELLARLMQSEPQVVKGIIDDFGVEGVEKALAYNFDRVLLNTNSQKASTYKSRKSKASKEGWASNFVKWLQSVEGKSENTVNSYASAVLKVLKNESLTYEGLDERLLARIIADYDRGGVNQHIGDEGNRTVINGLKALQRFRASI